MIHNQNNLGKDQKLQRHKPYNFTLHYGFTSIRTNNY
jgi:hypothetical protein